MFHLPLFIFAKEIFFGLEYGIAVVVYLRETKVVERCQILWRDPAYTPNQLFRKSNFRLTVSDSNDIGY